MKLETVKLAELHPLENNVRKHNDKQIAEFVKSLEQFGQTRAMVIDEGNNILIGNGLYMALQAMGKEDVICYRKTGLSEVQKKKLILSDNKIYSLGADDYESINDYIQDIVAGGDYDIAGYDKEILEQMTATSEQIDEAVAEYGKVTDDVFTREVVPTVNTVSDPNTPVPSSAAPTPTYNEPASQAGVRKSVVCPSCGEVIYLD